MKIVLTNTVAHVIEATSAEHKFLYQLLAYKDTSARHRRYYKGDGFVHLYSPLDPRFPAGFMREVYEAARAANLTIQYADRRTRPIEPNESADLSWLRDYQLEAVQAASKRTRGVIWAPTGSGKTEMAIGLTQLLPCRWLFLAHRAQLVYQAATRYQKRTGKEAGVIANGVWEERHFTAATFQTLYKRLKDSDAPTLSFLSKIDGVIIDEVHTLPATSYYQVSNALKNAYYRIGLSGTPLLRDDHKSCMVIGATGSVVYRIKAQTLIDAGQLAEPVIRMTPCEQEIDIPPAKTSRQRAKVWARVNDELIVNSDTRNAIIVDLVRRAAKPSLVFVARLDHGKILAAAIRSEGIDVEFVSGNKVTPQRLAAIKRLERGDVDVLVCTVVFNEGIDIPELRSVVIAGGGKSAIAALQRIGRGMRRPNGKSTFEVWDIADTGSLLETHAKKRRAAYRIEGYEVHE